MSLTAKRVVVIGWDGATFDVAKPLMARGRMPHLAALLAAYALLPASFYMTVDAVRVTDAREGEPPALFVQRTIWRDFLSPTLVTEQVLMT